MQINIKIEEHVSMKLKGSMAVYIFYRNGDWGRKSSTQPSQGADTGARIAGASQEDAWKIPNWPTQHKGQQTSQWQQAPQTEKKAGA